MTETVGPLRERGNGKAEARADILTALVEGTRRHGDLWELSPHLHVVAGLAMTRQILRDDTAFGVRSGTFTLPRHARQAVGSVRGARTRALNHRAVSRQTSMIAAEAAALAADWPAGISSVLPRLKDAVARIGTRYYFGEDAEPLMHAEDELARLRLSVFQQAHLPSWVPTPARLRVRRSHRALAGRVQQAIDRRLAHGRSGDDLLSALLDACRANGLAPRDNISHELAILMVAAQEMPMRAAGWLMLTLAQQPRWSERIADEACRVLPQEPGDTDATHVTQLTLTDAFVRETLRVHPTNYLIPRYVQQPITIDGHDLAPPDLVLVSPYLLHRDPRYFSDPDTFDPQRWLSPTRPAANGAYLPFGAGSLGCPGVALALLELTLIAAYVARSHRLATPEPSCYQLSTAGSLTPTNLSLHASPRN